MQKDYSTPRLLLHELTVNEAAFIHELVNTPEWIAYIGDRNIKSKEDAIGYIQKIIDNPNIDYWVVKTRDLQIPIGIISFIKRDFLDHHDIGFAFLPAYTKVGYAYEAAAAVLNDLKENSSHSYILATTVKENTNSIRLLEKLDFKFNKEIERENEMLLLYCLNSS